MKRLHVAWEDIYAASLKFLQPLTLQQTYKTIVKEAIKLLDADQGTVIMYKNRQLVRVYSSFSSLRKYEVSTKGRTFQTLRTGIPTVSLIKNENDIQSEIFKFGFQSIIFIPFSYGYKTKGVLNIFTKERIKLLKNEAFKLKLFGTMISETVYKAEQYENAEEAIQARDHFIAMASHELKNPLTSILMNAQLIKKLYNSDQIPQSHILESMVTQSLWLSKLIDETLAVGSLKKVPIRPVDGAVSLLDVLHLAITSFKASHALVSIELNEDIPRSGAFVHADYYKLLQMFVNILNNAAKFSKNNEPIVIDVFKKDNDIIINIKDKGIGIATSDLPRVFEGYYQGGKKNQPGVGLGLFLVKQIVEESNGKIELISKVHQGTTVSIILPIYART